MIQADHALTRYHLYHYLSTDLTSLAQQITSPDTLLSASHDSILKTSAGLSAMYSPRCLW